METYLAKIQDPRSQIEPPFYQLVKAYSPEEAYDKVMNYHNHSVMVDIIETIIY